MEQKESETEDLLKGKTLEIYRYLLNNEHSGIREIQKELDLPSPSSVSYHINKLVQANIVAQNDSGKYYICMEIETDLIRIRRKAIPRFIVYISFYSTITFIFFVIILFSGGKVLLVELFFFFFALFGSVINAFELYQIWRIRPI
ncbi:MAG: winged helix-turn-helix domain-containing protein [Candidatus Hodarchaeales archaeon]